MAKKSSMTEVLHLVFNDGRKDTTLKIAHPKENLTKEIIEDVMLSIIESGVFRWAGSDSIAKEAYIRRVYIDELVSVG
ncbi:DUF2922 domain-containing protein (plasmid) [Vagococcus sp. JNUCC 83]|uniref:DUF2922 domain-containing protein n=1 Tax=Vagococcus bubulae TaxID=1977868 RepID=UPI0022DFE029|nr:DUF2922 domain-containing protein [Vagococcus bubulae]